MGTKLTKIVAGTVGAVLIVVLALLAGRHSVSSPKQPAATESSATTNSTVAAALVGFRDAKAGWALSYPKAWNRLQSSDADVVLVVSEKAPELNTGGSILARDITLAGPVSDANLAAAREITDKVVTGEGVQLLAQPAVIHEGGLPGWFYFYSFKDPKTGQEGVHSHYFLFKGSTMVSVVFQALPKENFQGLATLYDDVIGSFKGST